MMRPFERVTGRLEHVRKSGSESVVALCPAHRDKRPSLSVKEGDDGRVLLYCFAGCPTSEVVAALNLSMRDLFPEKQSLSYPPRFECNRAT